MSGEKEGEGALGVGAAGVQVEPHSLCILVADHDKEDRSRMKAQLEHVGFFVHECEGGQQALECLRKSQVDLILVEVEMPEVDGLTILKSLKQENAQVSVIMMSSSEEPETLRQCFQLGGDDFLQKPISEDLLKNRVISLLTDRARRNRERLYELMLEAEKEKGEFLMQQMAEKEEIIRLLRADVSEVIETPIEVLRQTISSMLQGNRTEEENKQSLVTLIKSLGSDLYRPAFARKESADLDQQVREWLVNQYTQQEEEFDDESSSMHSSSLSDSVSEADAPWKVSPSATADEEDSGQDESAFGSLSKAQGAGSPPGGEPLVRQEKQQQGMPQVGVAGSSSLRPTRKTSRVRIAHHQVHEPSRGSPSGGHHHHHMRRRKHSMAGEIDFTISGTAIPLDEISSFDFNIFRYTEADILASLEDMMSALHFFDLFKLDRGRFHSFVVQVMKSYRRNPYHNFVHAMDVTQFIFACLNVAEVRQCLTDLDALSLFFGAMCHDLDHPGTNNNFQMNASTDLAIRYNDRSVLENYHCAFAFQLLQREELNFLEGMSPTDYKEFRRGVVNAILATDMAGHFEYVGKFQTRINTGDPLTVESSDDRTILMQVLMKCADTSNPSKPFPIASEWSFRVVTEFFAQGELEKELGLQVSPMMERGNTDAVKMQKNFIEFVTKPLFEALSKCFDSSSKLKGLVENMAENLARWEKVLEAFDSEYLLEHSLSTIEEVKTKAWVEVFGRDSLPDPL